VFSRGAKIQTDVPASLKYNSFYIFFLENLISLLILIAAATFLSPVQSHSITLVPSLCSLLILRVFSFFCAADVVSSKVCFKPSSLAYDNTSLSTIFCTRFHNFCGNFLNFCERLTGVVTLPSDVSLSSTSAVICKQKINFFVCLHIVIKCFPRISCTRFLEDLILLVKQTHDKKQQRIIQCFERNCTAMILSKLLSLTEVQRHRILKITSIIRRQICLQRRNEKILRID